MIGQHERELLEQHRALVERERTETPLTDGARVVERAGEVEPVGADVRHDLAGRRVADDGGIRGVRSGVHHDPWT